MTLLKETALKQVESICRVIIKELAGVVLAELKLVCKDVNELCNNTSKVLDHILVFLGSIKNSMPPAIISGEVAKLQTNFNVVLEGLNGL